MTALLVVTGALVCVLCASVATVAVMMLRIERAQFFKALKGIEYEAELIARCSFDRCSKCNGNAETIRLAARNAHV